MGWIGDRAREWRLRRSPLAKALRQHVTEFFYSGHTLAWMEKATKERFVAEFNHKATTVFNDADPIGKVRELICEYVLFMSPLLVAGLTETDKADHPLYADQPGISGKLYHSIRKVADHVDELGKAAFDQPDIDDDELRRFANTRSAVGLFFANGLNMIRIELGDTAEWFRPFLVATMVGDEDRLRNKVGLPRLLDGPVDGLAYYNFFEYVLSGDADPFFTWKKTWPRLMLCGKGDPADLSTGPSTVARA